MSVYLPITCVLNLIGMKSVKWLMCLSVSAIMFLLLDLQAKRKDISISVQNFIYAFDYEKGFSMAATHNLTTCKYHPVLVFLYTCLCLRLFVLFSSLVATLKRWMETCWMES